MASQYEYPDYYTAFHCIGGSCIDSCCAGWEVDIDENTASLYKALPLPIGDRIRKELTPVEGEYRFPLTPEKRCPFLNKDNLCDIILALGEGGLSLTCTEYPRFFREFAGYQEADLTLSCPEAARIFFSTEDPISYQVLDHEIHDPDWEEDPFSGEGEGDEKERDTKDKAALREVLSLRDHCLSILRERKKDIPTRLAEIRTLFPPVGEEEDRDLFCLLDRMEVINPSWTKILSSLKAHVGETGEVFPSLTRTEGKDLDKALDRFLTYLFYRYTIHIAGTGDREGTIRFILRCYRIFTLLLCDYSIKEGTTVLSDRAIEDAARIFSRQVEHSDRNVAILLSGLSFPDKEV